MTYKYVTALQIRAGQWPLTASLWPLTPIFIMYWSWWPVVFQKIYLYHFQNQLYADVLQNRCYWKSYCIHRKTSVLETLTQVFSCENYKHIFYIEHLWWLLLSVWKSNCLIMIVSTKKVCRSDQPILFTYF